MENLLILNLAGDFVNRLGKTPHVASGDAGNRDPPILGGIYGML